jgi:membrane dipeptidase
MRHATTIDPGLERAARELHRLAPVVDLHADPLLWSRLAGYDLLRRHTNRLPRSPYWSHSDVPRWQEAGVRVVLTGVVTLPWRRASRGCFRQATATIDCAERFERGSAGAFTPVRSAGDLERAAQGATIGAVLALEGVHALEGSLENLDRLIERGLRSVGLAHFHANAAVAPSHGPGGDHGPFASPDGAGAGLSAFGRALIDRLNEKKVAVDLAHVSRAGFFDAVALSKSPPFVSHTGLAGAHPHWRNIDDDQVKAVVDRGGIIGVIFAGRYLGGSRIADVVRHIEYLADRFGDRCVALGSDFDGMIVPVRGLGDVARLWRLTAALLARGHDEERVARILGGNALRYLFSVLG